MTRTRLSLAVLAAALAAAPADAAQLFGRKPSAARAKTLADTLRTDPDPARRKAAAAEFREYDHRLFPEVLPALVAALKRDPAGMVRAEAADAIGRLKPVTAVAGAALEEAAEADAEKTVRDAAMTALWEYHLNGYRSTKGAGGIAGQTAEPPIARPPAPKAVVTAGATTGPAPTPPPPPTVARKPPAVVRPPAVTAEPPVARAKPKVVVSAAPPVVTATPEPPLAPRPTSPVSAGEPPVARPPANLPKLPPPLPPEPVEVLPPVPPGR